MRSLKKYQVEFSGLENRLARMFNQDSGHCVMLAVDHRYFQGAPERLINLRKTNSLKEKLQKIPPPHLVITVSDLHSSYERLKEKNVKLYSFNERIFFCEDPDGYLVEVKQK